MSSNIVDKPSNKVLIQKSKIRTKKRLSINYNHIRLIGPSSKCPICKGTKVSKIELHCSFCDNEGIINETGKLLVKYNKSSLQLLGLIKNE